MTIVFSGEYRGSKTFVKKDGTECRDVIFEDETGTQLRAYSKFPVDFMNRGKTYNCTAELRIGKFTSVELLSASPVDAK